MLSELKCYKIAMMTGFIIGSILTIITPGSIKLIWFYFMMDSLILFLIILLLEKYINENNINK